MCKKKSPVICHMFHIMCHMSWFFFFALYGISCIFFDNVCCLRQSSKLKLHYQCNMSYGEWSIFPDISFLPEVKIIFLGFGFCSCSGKQKNHPFRLIRGCHATPRKVKRGPKTNYPKTFEFGLDHPPPLLDNVQK